MRNTRPHRIGTALHCSVVSVMINTCKEEGVAVAMAFGTKKRSPYSITERRVPELIPVLCSQPAGDGRLPLLSARPAVTLATLKRAATNFAAW